MSDRCIQFCSVLGAAKRDTVVKKAARWINTYTFFILKILFILEHLSIKKRDSLQSAVSLDL